MTRKIKYKTVSKELAQMVQPSINSNSRASIGLDQAVGEFFYIPVNQLEPFKNQSRRDFNQEDIEKLAESIKEYGVRQPLTIIKNDESKYEVISGERRLRASKLAGLSKVPCIILKEHNNADAIALIENIHRKDLHPVELGITYSSLLTKNIFINQEQLAQAISVPKSTISECIKYAKLPQEIIDKLISNNIVSRDKLRNLVKANNNHDIDKMRIIVGLDKIQHKNFSIIRVFSSEGTIKVQNTGISKLSKANKKILKHTLSKIIEEIEI